MPIIYNNSVFGQPPQALESDKKDELWKRANMDWIEQLLKTQLPHKQRRLIKNYNMAQGVIDVEDYINMDTNDYQDVYDTISQSLQDTLLQDNEVVADDLKFYPIVPSIINVLVGEMVKKFDHIKVKAVDEYSINEALEFKKELMINYLRQKAQAKIAEKIGDQIPQDSPEYQQVIQQGTEQVMNLPQIQKFMQRNYRSNYEEWASRVLEQSNYKYKLPEKEVEIFKHQLITDEAYVHVRLDENDVDVELWNPMDTLTIKTKYAKYTTEADLVGRQYYTTIHDIVSKYRQKIDAALIQKYNSPLGVMPAFSDRLLQPDDNRSQMVQEKKLINFKYLMGGMELAATSKVLVTECYWMSRRRLAKLKAVYDGVYIEKIVDDTFEPTMKPKYDKDKNLIAGEELEYFYAPQVWQGTKLNFAYGSVPAAVADENDYLEKTIFEEDPKKTLNEDVSRGWVYIDVKPVEYQFTDAFNPFKPKIPVVGCDGFEPSMNVGKLSLVDKTKAYQVLYNSCMNEIDKFMKDEIGLFYVMDQKLIPKNSIDGSWGKNNWAKFILTAKEMQLAPVDSSTTNTEGGQVMQQPGVINLLKNPQFQSRVQLASFFEQSLFKIIGVSPQRMGNISSQETATGINQAINNSYSQTEMYFLNHTNLMKELKEVILDAEKYMESKKPISRVQYINSDEENIMFELDTDDLLLRRYNIFLTSNPDSQRVLETLRQLAIQNNTSGASILDLATIIESNNIRDIKDVLAVSVENLQRREQEKAQREQEMLQQQLQAQAAEKEAERRFLAEEKQKDRIARMYEADVRATGMSRNSDLDQSGIPDALEVARFNLDQEKQYSTILNQEQVRSDKKQEALYKSETEKQKLAIKQSELSSKERIKQMEIQRDYDNMRNDEKIARLNAQNRPKKKES